MRVSCGISGVVLALLLVVSAQPVQAQGSLDRAPVHVTIQLKGPNGGPMQEVTRITLVAEDAHRPPEDFYTGSNGSASLGELKQRVNYAVVVASDGLRWGDTRHSFMAMGRRMNVAVQLEPLRRAVVTSGGPSVSAYSLRQDVPRAARREYDLALAQIEKDDLERAQKHLEQAVELFPDYVEALNELAVLLMKAEKPAEAEVHLRHALSIDTAAVRPQLNLGLSLLRQRKYPPAVESLERATQLDPTNAQAHLLLGSAYLGTGDASNAEKVWLRAYELGGKRMARANLELARLYARAGLYDRAISALSKYLEEVPDDPNTESLKETLARLRAAARSE